MGLADKTNGANRKTAKKLKNPQKDDIESAALIFWKGSCSSKAHTKGNFLLNSIYFVCVQAELQSEQTPRRLS